MTPDPASAVEEVRLALRGLAALAVLLGLGLWGLAIAYRRHVPVLLIGGAYLLGALP